MMASVVLLLALSGERLESIQELREYALQADCVEVLGYFSFGDGGGWIFCWEPFCDEDDGGITIASYHSSSGRWLRQWSGPIDVRWFGPKGRSRTTITLVDSGRKDALV